MNSPVIRSIDVGYGNTKFILSVDERGPRTMTFPSIAPPLSGSEIVPSANHLKNCKEIDVNGTAYQVGPDAGVARSKTYVDRLDDEYVLSDQYLALARGAMAYMDIDHIDYLVVGLPLRTLKTRSAELKSRLTGPHPMPNGKSILVKDVSTVIQPLGAFFHWMVTNKRLKQSGFAKERTLVVDPGFRTFDWMVTEGPNPIADLCGSVANGMSDVLTRMAEDISGTINAPVTDIRSLDVRWRENGEARFFGQPHDLNKHTEVAVQVAKDAIAALV